MPVVHKFEGQGVCEKHGEYTFHGRRVGPTVIGDFCPHCEQDIMERSRAANEKAEEVIRKAQWLKRMKAAGIPIGFLDSDFGNYLPTAPLAREMLDLVVSYTENFESVLENRPVSGLLFTGRPGTGKTHIACSMIKLLLLKQYCCLYTSCHHFLLAAKESQSFSSEVKTTEFLEQHISPHLLVLDEFGAHTTKDVDYQFLYSVIDGRYQRNLPTVLISNFTKAELASLIDERFMERIEGGAPLTLKFDWQSYRKALQD